MTGSEMRVVPFHGDQIVTFEAQGQRYVAMRHIVENMGLDWPRQSVKLSEGSGKFNCCHMPTVGSDGKQREMLSMPVEKLPLWLASINPNKIKDDLVRGKVERYQAESAIALHDYWTKGVAVKGDMDGIVTGLSPEVARVIGGIMKGIVDSRFGTLREEFMVAQLERDPRSVAVTFKPALEVLRDHKVPAKKRRAFSQKVSSRLRRYSSANGRPLRISRESGRYLFHVDAIAAWLRAEGMCLIRDHMSALSGQGVLKLVPGKQPEPQHV